MSMAFSLILLIYIGLMQRKTLLQSITIAASGWGIYLFTITELLSFGSHLSQTAIAVSWYMADLVLLGVCIFVSVRKTQNRNKTVKHMTERESWIRNHKIRTASGIGYCIFGMIMLRYAIRIVPYNYDSMTYHLSRIILWAENRSVAHFASNIRRAVSSPPLGEMVNLHVYLLSGKSDHYFNLLQCISFLIGIIFVYGIALKVSQDERSSCLSALLYTCTPIAFAESLTTQVDHFAALWLLIFCYTVLDLIQSPDKMEFRGISNWRSAVLALSAGLGYLTKPNVMIGMFGFTLWFIIVSIKRGDSKKLLCKWLCVTVGIALLVISPELIRNLISYHAISDPWQGKGQLIDTVDPRYVLVSLLKNLMFNMPSTFWRWADPIFVGSVYWTANKFQIDANSGMISEGVEYALTTPPNYDSDGAISPVPVAAMLICIIIFIIMVLTKKRKLNKCGYSTVAFMLYFIMCALIVWEPWVGRYQVPYFALICPAIAIQLIGFYDVIILQIGRLRLPVLITAIVAMSLYTLYGAFGATNKLLAEMESIERPYAYHHFNEGAYQEVYVPLEKAIDKYDIHEIGIKCGESSFMYPELKLLAEREVHFSFVNVWNETAMYEDLNYAPDYILLVDELPDTSYECHGNKYQLMEQLSEECGLYELQ